MACLLGELDTRDNSDTELASYSSRVQAVVDVDGPVDLTRDRDADGDKFFGKFFGGTFEQNPQAWRDASPVFRSGKDTAPVLIVHGTRDELVPMAQAEEFAAALDKAGVQEELVKVDDGHVFMTEAAQHRLAIETVAFFNRTLR
jgi:dipeptidyl aminopeptidase/acylaminoacyl peptidase